MKNKKKGNKVYLVVLEGGGDLYVKVVDEETFDWICSGKGWCREKFEGPGVTSGSLDNDRAIHAIPADGYDTYYTIKEAMQAIKKHGDELEDEYQGCMY